MATLKRSYDRFLKIRGNPKEIAAGFSLGLFVSMTPFMGFHTVIAVFLAALFKLNKISAAIAVWLSNPLTAPVVYGVTYYAGVKTLSYNTSYRLPEEFSFSALLCLIEKAPELIWILFVGGVVVGLPLAVVGYFFAYNTTLKYREKKERLKARFKRRKKRSRSKRRKKR